MSYIIGVDGGATKTLGVLFDESGNELKRFESGFANFNVNETKTISHIMSCINQLLLEIHIEELDIIQIGIAGYTNYLKKDELQRKLEELYRTKVVFTSDALLAYYSVKKDQEKEAIVILGGTGSVVTYEKNNEIHFIGGYGHLLGDFGSGYHVSVTLLKEVIRQHEEDTQITTLSKKVLAYLQLEDYTKIKEYVYNHSKKEIAHIASFIANEANNGDSEAITLLMNEGMMLAKQAINAYNKLNPKDEIIIGLRGSFLRNAPYVKEVLLSECKRNQISYELETEEIEPVFGAYYLALKQLNNKGVA